MKARLPDTKARAMLEEAVLIGNDMVVLLRLLERDEHWVIWNDGGAPFGRSQFRGPGYYTAAELTKYASHLVGRLEAIERSFERRMAKRAERA